MIMQYQYAKGKKMQQLKKIFKFVLGLFIIPVIISLPFLFLGIDYYEYAIGFFGLAYFVIYLIFPLLYRNKIQKIVPNKYIFYTILYIPFFILFGVWFLGENS